MLAISILSFAFPASAAPQNQDVADRLDRLCAELEAQRVGLHVPGCALCVVDDGKLLLSRGFGSAALDPARPVTPSTLFAIGSTTKAFTSALVATEVDAGRMHWDDPITRYLPEYRLPIRGGEEGAEVTLRDLMCHRTGFTRTDVLWASGAASKEQILAASLTAEPWCDFRSAWHYNNVMFLAAGEAVAVSAGKSWGQLLEERLLRPLGMEHTTTSTSAAMADGLRAFGYSWDPDHETWRAAPMRSVDAVAPAGAIWSSADDMSRWLRLQLAGGEWEGKRLIGADTLRETWTPQIEIGGAGASYGLGWMIMDWKGHTVVQHGGNIDGFSAMVGMIPAEGLGYVLLCNATATPLQNASLGIVWQSMLGDATAAADAAPLAAEDLSAYAGEYLANFASFRHQVFEVRVEKGKLGVDVPGQMFFTLKPPAADGRRAFELTDQIAVVFQKGADGKVELMRMHQAGLVFVLPRRGAEPADWNPVPDPAAEGCAGLFRREGSAAEWTLRAREGRLSLEIPGETEYVLTAADADGWRALRSMPDIRVRLQRSADQKVAALEFVSPRGNTTLTRSGDLPEESDLPTASELAARFGEAGRMEALRRLGGVRLQGAVRFVHGGAAGSFSKMVEPEGRALHRIDLGVFGHAAGSVDERGAAAAWVDGSFEPYRELAGQELQQALRTLDGRLWTRWAAGWDGATVLRLEDFAGERCAVVALRAGPRADTAWYCLEHLDLLRLDTQEVAPGGISLPVTMRFSDYRERDGVRIPWRTASESEASGRVEAIAATLETGLRFSDADFARPEPR